MSKIEERLYQAAREALGFSYAPYSDYAVAAAVKTTDGKIFTGVNVENASYGLTVCAERVALFNAIAAGCRAFTHLLVTSNDDNNLPLPCGACRQVLMEFSPDIKITVVGSDYEKALSYSLKELLPHAFNYNAECRIKNAELKR